MSILFHVNINVYRGNVDSESQVSVQIRKIILDAQIILDAKCMGRICKKN